MDTWVIGLLELLWNMVESIINACLRESVRLHDVRYGFHTGRGIGTVTLELKLVQEIGSMNQDPLLMVFLDLRKDYETV